MAAGSPAETIKLVRRPLSETLRYLASKLNEPGTEVMTRATALSVALALEATADEVAPTEVTPKAVRVITEDAGYVLTAARFDTDDHYLVLTGSDSKVVACFAPGRWHGVWVHGTEAEDAGPGETEAGS